jgi:predicted transposase YbfD/YdcC
MGCQREIAAQIKSQGGDYVLAVKDNQPTLHEKVRNLLDEAVLDGFAGMSHGYDEQSNKGHGRLETRKTWVTDEVKWLGAELLALWPGLASVTLVQSTRQDLGDVTGKVSTERRYYISSLKGNDAAKMARAVRGHWGVENKLHWRLDMSFREDESRLRKDHSAENFSRLRRIAMNQLRKQPDKKISLKGQRYLCSLDPDYLLKRLQQ